MCDAALSSAKLLSVVCRWPGNEGTAGSTNLSHAAVVPPRV